MYTNFLVGFKKIEELDLEAWERLKSVTPHLLVALKTWWTGLFERPLATTNSFILINPKNVEFSIYKILI